MLLQFIFAYKRFSLLKDHFISCSSLVGYILQHCECMILLSLSSKFWLRNALVIWYGDPLWQVAFYCFFLSVLLFLLKLDNFLWGHSLFGDVSTLLLNLHMDNFIHSLYCTLEFIFHFNMVFRSCVDMLQVYVSSSTESSYLEPFLAYWTCIKFHFNLCQARHWFPFLWVGCCRIIQNSQCHAFINL